MPYPLLKSGSDFYVAVNTSALPSNIRPQFSHPLADNQWPHIHTPGPAITAFPQLPFILTNPPFVSCRLLGSLSCTIVKRFGQDSYGIERTTCDQWKQLETDLVDLTIYLCNYAKTANNVIFPPTFDPTCAGHLPSALRYHERRTAKPHVAHVMKHTISAFELLIATVSFAIACSTRDDDDPGHPAWAIYLQDVIHISATTVDALKKSPVCHPTAPRAGAFIMRDTDRPWICHVPQMERFGCPLYILWNNVHWWIKCDYVELDKYRPEVDQYKPKKDVERFGSRGKFPRSARGQVSASRALFRVNNKTLSHDLEISSLTLMGSSSLITPCRRTRWT